MNICRFSRSLFIVNFTETSKYSQTANIGILFYSN